MRKLISMIGALMMAANIYAGPEIKWLSLQHNFGAFSEDSGKVSCRFEYVNTGDEALQILSARSSCGCTEPIYSQQPVAPGDTSQIEVSYDPQGRPGRFNKSISIDTNTPEKRSRLSITGVVIGSEVSVSGRYPVDKGAIRMRNPAVIFGKVAKPHLKTVFAEGYNRSRDSLTMRVVSKPKCIDINFEPKIVGPGEQVSVICYLRSGDKELWGLVEDSVVISAGKEQFALPFTAMIEEDFSKLKPEELEKAAAATLQPESLDFGTVKRNGEEASMEAELHNTGRSTLEVHRVYSSDDGISATIDHSSIKKGKRAKIRVTVDPRKLRGVMLNARVNVISNDPANPTGILRVVGEIK